MCLNTLSWFHPSLQRERLSEFSIDFAVKTLLEVLTGRMSLNESKIPFKVNPFKGVWKWGGGGHNEHSTIDNDPSIIAFHLRITIHSEELFSLLGMSQVPTQTNVDAAQPNHK